MSDPLSVVAKVASTPDQAKIYVAMLQAEGIPAYIEGGALADEFAMSQRLMNVSNVKVMVPASSLEQARQILQPADIDQDDLAAQAMSATDAVEPLSTPRQRATADRPGSTAVWIALIATVAALGFMFAWIGAINRYADDPLYTFSGTDDGTSVLLRRDGSRFAFHHDQDHDGVYEQFEFWGPEDSWHDIAHPLDRDGRILRVVSSERDGLTQTWSRDSAETLFTTCTVTDAAGNLVQTLRWQPGKGFTLE